RSRLPRSPLLLLLSGGLGGCEAARVPWTAPARASGARLIELGAKGAQVGGADPQHRLEEGRPGDGAKVIAGVERAAEAGRDREAVERDPAELPAGDRAAQAA